MTSRLRPEWRAGRRNLRLGRTGPMPNAFLVIASLIAAALAGMPPAANAQEQSGNVRLLAAARSGDPPGVIRALGDGASPNARNRIGETALLIALKNNRPELARQMIGAGTDVNLAAVNGVTPLMAAAHGGQTEIVELLLAKGADVGAVDRLKKNAMTYAAGQGQ